jgi:hypothetical protein
MISTYENWQKVVAVGKKFLWKVVAVKWGINQLVI